MLLNSFPASVVRNYLLSCVFRTISWHVLSGTVSCHLLSGTVSCHVLSGTNSYHALFLVTYLDCTNSCHEMALLFPIIYGKDRTSNQMVPLVLPVLSHYFRSFLVTPCRTVSGHVVSILFPVPVLQAGQAGADPGLVAWSGQLHSGQLVLHWRRGVAENRWHMDVPSSQKSLVSLAILSNKRWFELEREKKSLARAKAKVQLISLNLE